MNTFRDVINAWPTLDDFASDIRVEPNTAKQMRTRNSVAAAYWPDMISGAKRRKIVGVSLEKLAALAAARRAPVQRAS